MKQILKSDDVPDQIIDFTREAALLALTAKTIGWLRYPWECKFKVKRGRGGRRKRRARRAR